jgi:predicted AAA+ superfamily ATPase
MFDAKGKKILQTSSKYYCIDVAIKNIQSNFFIKDRGKLLENIVFLELLRRGYEVRVGKLRDGKEIDFIAQKENDPDLIYIQVVTTLDTDKIKEREYGNLTSIRDSHKKMVITEDQVNFTDKQGIKTINVVD